MEWMESSVFLCSKPRDGTQRRFRKKSPPPDKWSYSPGKTGRISSGSWITGQGPTAGSKEAPAEYPTHQDQDDS